MRDYDSYKMPPTRTGAWVMLIFASIAALVDVYFWLPIYRACQAANHNVLSVVKSNTRATALFILVAFVFFFFSIIASIKFSKAGKFWGRSFGGFLGRLVILLEYAVYVFAILLLFF